MQRMERDPTIAVWGHYHGGNLGDELVVATIIDAIRRRMPGARIVGISMAPADTRERHGIDGYPINPTTPTVNLTTSSAREVPTRRTRATEGLLRASARRVPGARRLRRRAAHMRKVVREVPFLWRSYRMLRRLDLVVVAGSGQLLDEWDGPWLHPYTTFRWAMLARLARLPMAFLSVGAGPIDSKLSAFFIRRAVASACYVSVRDRHSGQVLTSIGLAGPFPLCPDIGYGLLDELLQTAVIAPAGRRDGMVVGLNVVAHQDPRYWPHGDARRYEVFLLKMAEFARWLLDNGYTVRLFSSQPRADGRVADDLVALLGVGRLDLSRLDSAIEDVEQIEDLVSAIAGCDCVVAGRYHSALLPLLLDIPVLGLAYNEKTRELFAAVGHPERCLDIDRFSVQSLIAALGKLSRHEEPGTQEARRARVAGHRAEVEMQFDRIFARGESEQSMRKAMRLLGRRPDAYGPAEGPGDP
jgi:polysaccharide pyruvyl transferase WcaK-like protein